MALVEGVDYSTSRPDPAGLFAAGKRFACRYLSYNTAGKNLTVAERDRLWAAGLAVVLNWESSASAAAAGYGTGVQHARDARAQARELGAPDTVPIYFSVDFSPTASEWTGISEYFRGVRSVIGKERTGIYGGLATMDHAIDGGWARWFWQTYAWSGGVWRAGIHIRQYKNGVTVAGGDCDLDTALSVDYGQWTGADMASLTTDDAGWLDTLFRVDSMLRMQDPASRTKEPNELAKAIRTIATDAAAARESSADAKNTAEAALAAVNALAAKPTAIELSADQLGQLSTVLLAALPAIVEAVLDRTRLTVTDPPA